ncbi:hypothetical protein AESSP_00033 [Aestuariimicrobium sp. T2.26MG-19.2B]|nr:hypothetical protein AESSP_00033 [Aestuariimicrobium sp. T2.26MG-19.2B]
MRIYASGRRATRQAVGDLLVVCWVVGWVWAGVVVHRVIAHLADPIRQTANTSGSIASQLREASSQLGRVPAVGDQLMRPFDRMAGDLDGLVAQAHQQVAMIGSVATVLGLVTALAPIALVLTWWVPRRVAFVRNASAAQRFIDADADLDLFALRALAHQPMPQLAKVSADPMGDWRRRDPRVVEALARLELDRLGMVMPGRAEASAAPDEVG